MQPGESELADQQKRIGGPYAWYVVGVLVLVYVINFIDRQIISILAEDIKADLGIGDSEIGFLYGTVFGIFYALFGIPLGRLADMWHRIRLLSIGLGLWSVMTMLSGLARGFPQLALARVGVGIGEATAAPVAFSVVSDYFPREKRATALAVYSSGLFLGGGLSLFLGGFIKDKWNLIYPDGGPLGLVGWQAAFMAVGLPGLFLALWVATLKEPVRGLSDGMVTPAEPHPWRRFLTELASVLPPFTLFHAAGFGARAAFINIAGAVFVALLGVALFRWLGNWPQWLALGIGAYAVFSWAQSIRHRDPPTFALVWGTPSFVMAVMAFGLISLIGYSIGFWSAPYAMRTFGINAATAGLFIGGGGAAGGFLGVILGGHVADWARKFHASGRIHVPLVCIWLSAPIIALQFTTASLPVFFACYFAVQLVGSTYLGVAAATSQDLVLPRMRGAATATYLLGTTMIGLGLGPFSVGRLSEAFGALGPALLSLLVLLPVITALLWMVHRKLPAAEASRVERAVAAGEKL